jgi:hypothetical protein
MFSPLGNLIAGFPKPCSSCAAPAGPDSELNRRVEVQWSTLE